MSEDDVVIAGACRTAIGSFLGSLCGTPAVQLGAGVIAESLRRSGVHPDQVSEVILGCVLTAGLGQNLARQAAVAAGMPVTVPAETINFVCGSGMRALIHAAQAIRCGDARIVVAGGVENMSLAAYALPRARQGLRMGTAELLDTVLSDGLLDAFDSSHMGVTAERIAARYGITRADADAFACASQNRAETAIRAGRFQAEIVPIAVPAKKDETVEFVRDEFPRFGTTEAGLAKLKPAFQADGVVTAGNASGINDGAAAMVVMSGRVADELGVRPMARVRAYGLGGVDPEVMGLGPIPATRRALSRAEISIAELDLIEANEAFAVQALAVARELGLPPERTNVNGGAIALGHPIGASGARIVVTLLHEMARRSARMGLATLCIGGGMGSAVIVERRP